jgi:hypothetical protein
MAYSYLTGDSSPSKEITYQELCVHLTSFVCLAQTM